MHKEEWLLAGLVLVGGIGLVRIATSRPKLKPGSRLMLIGDSLAQGLAVPMKALAARRGVHYVGSGVAGSRLDQWATSRWLDDKLVEFKPNVVLVSLGTNDAYMQLSNEQREAHLRSADALMRKLHGAGAEVVWIGVPKLPKVHLGRTASKAMLDGIRSRQKYYFPSEALTIPRGPDGLHPNVAGYGGWAAAVWDWVT